MGASREFAPHGGGAQAPDGGLSRRTAGHAQTCRRRATPMRRRGTVAFSSSWRFT